MRCTVPRCTVPVPSPSDLATSKIPTTILPLYLIFKCRRSQGFLYDCRGQTRVNAPCASPPYFNQAAYSVMRRCQVLGTKRKSCARPEHYLTRLGHLRQSLLYCTTPSYHSRDGVRGPT